MTITRKDLFNRDDMAKHLKDAVPYPALKQAIILNVTVDYLTGEEQTEVVISAHSTFGFSRNTFGYVLKIQNDGIDKVYTLVYRGYDKTDEAKAALNRFQYIRDSLQFLAENNHTATDFLNSIYEDDN